MNQLADTGAVTLGPARAADLVLVGEFALALDRVRSLDELDAALERLRDRVRAQACDLFLTHPDGTELFLVSHLGADMEAFCQKSRFRMGEGFPGIAVRTAATLWTANLAGEVDFVRSRVKSAGYSDVVCVPLATVQRMEGCLLMAWRDGPVDLTGVIPTLRLVALPFAASVELLRARLQAPPTGGAGVSPDPAERLRVLCDAQAAEVRAVADVTGAEGQVRPARCPACRNGSVQVLGGRAGWPRECLAAGCSARARYCVGFRDGTAAWSVATLAFQNEAPRPLTRHVPTALWLSGLLRAAGAPVPESDTAEDLETPQARLEIRLLGPFQVLLHGEPVPAARFGRSKAMELLAILASEPGAVPFEDLESRLWPDADSRRTRNRLHVTVCALRSALGPDGDRLAAPIVRDGRRYVLDRDASVTVDLWRFRELLASASTRIRRGAPARTVAPLLEAALALVSGPTFGGTFPAEWAVDLADRVEAQIRWGEAALARLDPGR